VLAAARHIELAPHCSLSPRAARVFFGLVCAVTLGIAGAATAMGFWPVLPFAGLEVIVLWWALRASMQRRFERETIEVSETRVVVEYSRGEPRRFEFPRHWARVKIRHPKSPLHRGRLVIESQGRGCEVGEFLSEEERHRLAADLRRLIGGMNQSPALPDAGSHE
jgi:uncharacterized membrane protein